MAEAGGADGRWAQMLARWSIPEEILAAAPNPPYFFDPQVFIDGADQAIVRAGDTPSDEVAREALAPGGTVLDVGCGAGAASLRLRPARVVGVDRSSALLAAFRERAVRLGIEAATLEASGLTPPHGPPSSMSWSAITWSTTWLTSPPSPPRSTNTPVGASLSSSPPYTRWPGWRRT